jgi:Acyclic terpene utilisation family protein AtuA
VIVRIGNCSGFYGDRIAAMREMLTGGELDFLTGDYLAELTMLILGRDKMKNPERGYAKTFLVQLEQCLGLAHDKGVRIVANAGGLNPAGLADAVRALAERLGVPATVAHVEGDDLLPRAAELGLGAAGRATSGTGAAGPATSGTGAAGPATSGTGAAGPATSGAASPLTANAYLGTWGIVDCLNSGADVVVTGRVTDASVVVGPAAAHFGWGREDYDRLAGAVVAGHVIECGTQATGGNYSFFTEIPDLGHAGFPLAEVYDDGSSVITKHPDTGGQVSLGTVTAQLLYEIGGARYANPDVTARFDSITLTNDGPDRVRISGVRGEPPPPSLKVSLNSIGGFRNSATFVLTGLDIGAKAELVRRQLESALTVTPAELGWTLARTDHPDADTEEAASALLTCVVRDSDPNQVGRRFSSAAVELALASYPGFTSTSPPGDGQVYGVFTAGYVPADVVEQVAVRPDGSRTRIPAAAETLELADVDPPQLPEPLPSGATRKLPLGTIAGARSGDKGGAANIGVWVRTHEQWRWLAHHLTADALRELLPETKDLPISHHLLPNLRAVNFVIEGILGKGVAYNARFDPQAKGLGEWLRSRHVDIPEAILP